MVRLIALAALALGVSLQLGPAIPVIMQKGKTFISL